MTGTDAQVFEDLIKRRAELEAADPESFHIFFNPGQTTDPEKARDDGERIRQMALAEVARLIRNWFV